MSPFLTKEQSIRNMMLRTRTMQNDDSDTHKMVSTARQGLMKRKKMLGSISKKLQDDDSLFGNEMIDSSHDKSPKSSRQRLPFEQNTSSLTNHGLGTIMTGPTMA